MKIIPLINIAIIDHNAIHRASLKTMLGQIDGFRVVMDSDDLSDLSSTSPFSPDVVLMDNSMGNELCSKDIKRLNEIIPGARAMILAMFREELDLDYGTTEVILKSSEKKEFEKRIRNIKN